MWLTRKGLEQATRSLVGRIRAHRIAEIFPRGTVLDATSGVGGDALELAVAGLRVVAADLDRDHAAIAASNLARMGHAPWAVVARAEQPACRADVIVIDPDRRTRGRRTLDPASWSPPWSETVKAASGFRGACVKLAPAFEPSAPAVGSFDGPHAWEWWSDAGELVEVCLWLGGLAGERRGARAAVRIERGARPLVFSAEPCEVEALEPPEAAAAAWLADPDPALIRSGLLGAFARSIDARPLGPRIAFLGGARRPASPWIRSWLVLESAPADPRSVRAMLARHGIGRCDVLRRGHPSPTEELERVFRGRGRRRGLLAVARLARGHRAFLLGAGAPA
jgi:hypothetical protein